MDLVIPKVGQDFSSDLSATLADVEIERSTIGKTGNAQFSNAFGGIVQQNIASAYPTEFVPDFEPTVDSYISRNGLSKADADYLKVFGSSGPEALEAAIETIEARARNAQILENSTGANIMLTAPSTIFSLAIPIAGSAVGKILATVPRSLNLTTPLRIAGTPIRSNASNFARIGSADALISESAVAIPDALNEVSRGADPSKEAANVALAVAGAAAFGGLVGGALGAVVPNRVPTDSERYLSYLRGAGGTPETIAQSGSDLTYKGEWFLKSLFVKLMPSPMRSEMLSKSIPDWAKSEILGVGGDNSMPFVANQLGKVEGNSVFIEAGRRQGDWFKALDVMDKAYRAVSPRGNASVLNVPVGEYVEIVRKKIGITNFTKSDFYNHIGRLYVDEVPLSKMTPDESSAVNALEEFFKKYEDELVDVNLINPRDIFITKFNKATGRQENMVSAVTSIMKQNQRWMKQASEKLRKEAAKKDDILKDLGRKRSLTTSQRVLRDKLKTELIPLNKDIAEFEGLGVKISEAKTPEDLIALIPELKLTLKMQEGLKKLSIGMQQTKIQIEGLQNVMDLGARQNRTRPRHFPRFYNRPYIQENRDAFAAKIIQWFKENPEVAKYDPVTGVLNVHRFSTSAADLAERAEKAIDNILDETVEEAMDAVMTPTARSGPMVSRRLDIPNSLITDFIITDAKEVMISYLSRVGPRLEYHKKFRNPKNNELMTMEDRLVYLRERLASENVPINDINKYIKNYTSIYDQVVGTNRKRVDAWDTDIADGLRAATSWAFLKSSGVAAIGDAASLFMDHELRTIGKGALALMDDVTLGMGKRELQLAGEALEMIRGVVHLREMESLSNNIIGKSTADKANNAFFTLNLLGPTTVMIKSLDAILRSHTIIERSAKLVAGTADDFEITFLSQYNIDLDLAARIGKMPTKTSEGGLNLANTEAWASSGAYSDDILTDTVDQFRNALRSGVMNRVIMGTPADMPILAGGVAYIPDSLADKLPFNLPKDSRVQGYRRVESGLLALPFTFYSYTIGAMTKVTGNYAAGAVRNKLAHATVAMILGAGIVKFRTPSFAWNEMSAEDKLTRAFDFSGLAALYSDMGYRALTMAQELGADISESPIQPKFPSKPDTVGAVTSLGGAPADWSLSVVRGVGDMLEGNVSDGAKAIIRVAPLIDAAALAGVFSSTANAIADQLPNKSDNLSE